jgi:isocitrate dehydrogenase kinase/phosphatase
VELEKSEKLLKNPASVIDQFANAQTRRIDLVLLTKATVTIVLSLSLTGFIAYAPRFPATLVAFFEKHRCLLNKIVRFCCRKSIIS